MLNTNTTTRVIDADDFFSTFEKELTEPIPGEQFDIVVVLPRTRDHAERRVWGKPTGKPRYKK
jgi:hypothetical protein